MKIDVRTARAICSLMPGKFQSVFNTVYFSDKHRAMFTTDGISVLMLSAGDELPSALDSSSSFQDWTAVTRKTIKQAATGLKVSDWIDLNSLETAVMSQDRTPGFGNVYESLYRVTTFDEKWLVPPTMDTVRAAKLLDMGRAVICAVNGFFAPPGVETVNELLSKKDMPFIKYGVCDSNQVYETKFNGYVIRYSLAGMR